MSASLDRGTARLQQKRRSVGSQQLPAARAEPSRSSHRQLASQPRRGTIRCRGPKPTPPRNQRPTCRNDNRPSPKVHRWTNTSRNPSISNGRDNMAASPPQCAQAASNDRDAPLQSMFHAQPMARRSPPQHEFELKPTLRVPLWMLGDQTLHCRSIQPGCILRCNSFSFFR